MPSKLHYDKDGVFRCPGPPWCKPSRRPDGSWDHKDAEGQYLIAAQKRSTPREEVQRVVGQRLRQARLEAGMNTVGQLEDATGVPKAYIYEYEQGRRLPAIDTMLILAQTLDISVDWWLFEGLVHPRYVRQLRKKGLRGS